MLKQEELSLNDTILLRPASTDSFVKISSNIFTVFVGLIASGYEFSYDQELARKIKSIDWDASISLYFRKARTSYCEVYPYWPRAAMLVTASLFINESLESGYADFKKVLERINSYTTSDPGENSEETELWLSHLPIYYRLIRETSSFHELWLEYKKRSEAVAALFQTSALESRQKIRNKFKIPDRKLPEIRSMPNILGCGTDFEKMDETVYVVCPRPDSSCFIHEYLHNILDPVLNRNTEKIKKSVSLLDPVFEKMYFYKYAWAKDASSWYRIFEENLVRASTIWVNEIDLKEAERKAIDLEKEGFLYVPELLNQLQSNWRSIAQFDNFIEGCLAACQSKCDSNI